MSTAQLALLSSGTYTACDISDALQKLHVPHAGFLADLDLKSAPQTARTTPLVALATTILLAPKSSPTPTSALPPGTHFADLATAPDTIVVLSAPAGTRCAVMGGLVAARLEKRGVVGAVVGGRVRDLKEMPAAWEVWALGVSTVGAGAETRVVGIDVKVEVCGVVVEAGDVVFCDAGMGGVVVIPRGRVGEVVGLLPGLVEADEKVAGEVEKGVGLAEAFKLHRG